MDPEFWHQRWHANQIGFHQSEINPHLVRYWDRLATPPGGTVLVPLCGKSRDMCWLAERHPVLGVELSPRAVEAFCSENDLNADGRREGAFQRYDARGVTLLCGDFFDLEAAHTRDVAAVYDRAALIALPPEMRRAYAEKLAALVKPGTPMLLITLQYDSSEMQGPPFSVAPAEVETLFGDAWRVNPLADEDVLDEEPRFRERGLSGLAEQVYLLVRK